MTVYVARHGRTGWNDARKIGGVTDVALTDEGRAQAAALAETLTDSGIDLVIASPLSRAVETARPTAEKLGVPLLTDPRLAERNFGELEGASYDDERLGPINQNFALRPEGGESLMALAARIYPFLAELPQKYPGKTVLLLTHSAAARCIHSYYQSLDNAAYRETTTDNCAVRTYPVEDGNAAAEEAPKASKTEDFGGWRAVKQGYHALCAKVQPWHLCLLAAVALAAVVVPLLLLGRYNYPMVDDYFFAQAGRDAWLESHSIPAVLAAAANYTRIRYLNWQGPYVTTFVNALQPSIFGERFQAVGPVLILGALCAGVLFFSWAGLRRCLGASRSEAALTGLAVCFILTQFAPSQNEGFYWYTGAATYTLAFSVLLLQAGAMLCLHSAKTRRGRVVALVFTLLGAAFMGGSWYMASLQCFLVQCLFVALPLLQKDKRWKWAMAPLLVLTAGFAVSLLAPGNALRADFEGGSRSPVSTVLAALADIPHWLGQALRFPIWVFLLALVPVFWGLAGRTAFRFRWPGLVLVVSYLFLAAGLCPGLYSLQGELPRRYQNWMFFTSAVVLIGCLLYCLGWLRQKLVARHAEGRAGKDTGAAAAAFCRRNSLALLAGLALVLTAGSALIGPKAALLQYAGVEAAYTIRSGDALAYRQEMDYRNGIFNTAAPGSDVNTPLLEVKPHMLFRHDGDISDHADSWLNGVIAKYYGLGSVTGTSLWTHATEELAAAQPGEVLAYPASKREVVEPRVFGALRDKDVTLILQRPGETYVFHGQAIDSIEPGTYYSFADLAALGYRAEATPIGWF